MFCRIVECYYQNIASLCNIFSRFLETEWGWRDNEVLVSTTAGYAGWFQSEQKVLQHTMSLATSLFKYMSCFTYIFLSYQQAGFSEGVLASKKQKCLQCSAKHPGSINHGCWITLGVPQVCLHMWALWFDYDSNMAKRCSVSSIVDSYHRHGSSK